MEMIVRSVLFLIGLAPCFAQLRLIEIDPGHAHLNSFESHMLPGVSDVVQIYSPFSPELTAHLAAIARNNARASEPTHWNVQLFAGPDYMKEFARQAPGAIVALSGRNSINIDYIEAALKSGDHLFVDKPWIVDVQQLPRLEAALKLAHEKHLVTFDWMSLRADAAYRLVRDLVGNKEVFGEPEPGTPEQPSVHLENLHALVKFSNGVPQKRPAAFVDNRQQGEGMADVGTHLVDIAQWTLFHDQTIYRKDVRVLHAEHAPLMLTLDQFTRLTGETAWPAYLKDRVADGKLPDYTNNTAVYVEKGVHVAIKVGWRYEAAPGEGDSYFTSYQGTYALVELRAGPKENYVPEIYLTPSASAAPGWDLSVIKAFPHLNFEPWGHGLHVILPKSARAVDGFREMFEEFSGYIRDFGTFPERENENLLTKYYITTTAVAMAK